MAYGPKEKFRLIKQHGTTLCERGFDPIQMSCADLVAALHSIGADFTDCEGNYWGHTFNNDGKSVRVCIPAGD
jgi:hypothetical protein